MRTPTMFSVHSIVILLVIATTTRKCGAEYLMLVARETELYYVNLSETDDRANAIPVTDVIKATSLDYDPVGDHIYWCDVGQGTISRARLDGKDQRVIISNLNQAYGIALDVDARMLYWTDTGNGTIWRSYLDGSKRAILLDQDLKEPESILLDTRKRRLYWADLGQIECVNLDGLARETIIVMNNTCQVKALTLDVTNQQLYWINTCTDKIEVINTDGSERHLYEEKYITSLSYYGGYLYYSDQNSIGKMSGGGVENETSISTGSWIQSVVAFTSKSGQDILLVGLDSNIQEINLDLKSYFRTMISARHEIYSLDYDLNEDKIYWSDADGIHSVNRDGSGKLTLLGSDGLQYTSIALSLQNNELIYYDSFNQTIEKISLSQHFRTTLFEIRPWLKDIAIDPLNRYIYWMDENYIYRATIDGENKTTIIPVSSYYSMSMALDVNLSLIYWTENCCPCLIYVANIDGSNKRALLANTTPCCYRTYDDGMTLLGDYLYITCDDNKIYRVNRFDINVSSVVYDGNLKYNNIKVIQRNNPCTSNPCENGATCHYSRDGYFCQCKPGYSGRDCEVIIGIDPTGMNNPCSNLPCQNGGTCKVLNDYFICHCEYPWFGKSCQYDQLPINKIRPLFGPVAGGTNITIEGVYFPSPAQEIHFGHIAKGRILSTNHTSVIGQTTSVNTSYAGSKFPISITFERNLNLLTGFSFEFKGNPKINSLYPLEMLKKGGTKLMVTGDNLDAVEMPRLKLDRVVQLMQFDKLINESITTYYGDCLSVNQSQLVCLTPNINISDNAEITSQQSETPSADKDLDLDNKESERGIKEVEGDIKQLEKIYIGLVLDGVADYKNLSDNPETKAYGSMKVVEPPSFLDVKENLFEFKPKQQLQLKGKDIDHILMADYKVDIGEGICVMLKITSTELYCMPPQKEPRINYTATAHTYNVVVHIGQNIDELIGEISYPNYANMYIGIGCAGILLLVIVVLIIVLLLRTKHGRLKRQQHGSRNREREASVINLPAVQVECD